MSNTIEQIENKLEQYEKEYLDQNKSLCNRVKQYALNEENYLTQINNLKRDLCLFQNENMQILNDSNNLQCHYESLKIEYQRLINCFNDIEKNYEELKCKYKKIEENSIKNENKIKEMELLINEKDGEIKSLKELNEKYLNNYEDLFNKYNFVKDEKDNNTLKSNNFQNQVNDLSNENSILENDNKKLKLNLDIVNENTEKLNKEHSDLYEKYNILLKEKNSLEHKFNKLQFEKDNINKELEVLKNSKNNFDKSISKINNQNNSDLIKLKSEIQNLTSISNENINQIINWIESYFLNFYSEYITLPGIDILNNTNINFDLLQKCLSKTKNSIDNHIIDLNKQIKNLKKTILNCQDDNYKMQKNLEDIYQHIICEIEKGKYFTICKFKLDGKLFDDIEDLLNKVFTLLKRIKIANEENCLDKLIDDNYILNNCNKELNEKIDLLYKDNCILNNQIKELSQRTIQIDTNLEEDNRKLIKDNVALIKKIKELKEQLSSLTSLMSTQN